LCIKSSAGIIETVNEYKWIYHKIQVGLLVKMNEINHLDINKSNYDLVIRAAGNVPGPVPYNSTPQRATSIQPYLRAPALVKGFTGPVAVVQRPRRAMAKAL
jgi:hypothetical protein